MAVGVRVLDDVYLDKLYMDVLRGKVGAVGAERRDLFESLEFGKPLQH